MAAADGEGAADERDAAHCESMPPDTLTGGRIRPPKMQGTGPRAPCETGPLLCPKTSPTEDRLKGQVRLFCKTFGSALAPFLALQSLTYTPQVQLGSAQPCQGLQKLPLTLSRGKDEVRKAPFLGNQ